MAEEKNQDKQANSAENQPQFLLETFHLKDLSFEAPNGINFKEWKPDLKIDGFEISSHKFENADKDALDRYESQLKVCIKVKSENKTAFIIEILYAGVFTIHGFDEEQLNILLAITCPNIVFPYLREAVSNVVTKGGFPALLLPPPNFEALYQQKMSEGEKEKETVN